jgi:hypothetical protein
VSVEPTYLEANSSPGNSQYFWAYRVTIENQGRETVQLLNRHWMITNARGEFTEVKGRCYWEATIPEAGRELYIHQWRATQHVVRDDGRKLPDGER